MRLHHLQKNPPWRVFLCLLGVRTEEASLKNRHREANFSLCPAYVPMCQFV